MANVQIENGYTKIANELLDALCKTRISGEARQILDVIFRKTYGYNKKADSISLGMFEEMTGIPRPTCVRGIKKLINMNIISVNKEKYISKYSVNKNYESWEVLSKKITVKKGKSVDNNDNKVLTKMITLIDNNDNKSVDNNDTHKRKKDNIKENKEIYIHDLQKEIIKKYPHVAKMEIQLSKEDCEKLTKQFTDIEIHEILALMENYKPLLKNNRSVYLTFLNWQKRNNKTNGSNGKAKIIFNDTLDLSNG